MGQMLIRKWFLQHNPLNRRLTDSIGWVYSTMRYQGKRIRIQWRHGERQRTRKSGPNWKQSGRGLMLKKGMTCSILYESGKHKGEYICDI